jgi:Bacterial Ig-like domain (group 2)/Divergent InlB B-repeat domain
MSRRSVFLVPSVLSLVLFLSNCGNHQLVSLSVSPSAVTTAVGQNVQFHAIGSYVIQSESHPRPGSNQDITDQVSWTSTDSTVATVSSSGAAQVLAPGSTTITATKGNLSASAVLSAGGPGGTGSLGLLTAITILPSSQATQVLGESVQYIAIGTMSGGSSGSSTSQDVTDLVKWVSSDQSIVTIDSSGLATAIGAGAGGATITALGTASDGNVITGSAAFSGCTAPCGTVILSALGVFEVGLGTGSVQGFDNANPAVIVIDCDPSVGKTAACTGNFPVGSTITLTATPGPNSTFGGWSATCTPDTNATCSVTIPANQAAVPVGAIFNQ